MAMTTPRWRSRSSIAAATTGSPKAEAQPAIPTLVVNAVLLPLAYLVLMTWNNAEAASAQREVAQFINCEEFGAGVEPHHGGPPAFDGGLVAAGGEVGGGGEVDPVPGLGGGPGQPDREHCLTDPGWADQQDVGAVVDEPQGGQLPDQGLIDAGLGGEVEVGQ